jgi:hypothetical protein
MLAEPGTSSIVLERLAAHAAKGIPVDRGELGDVLNGQIVEHAPLGHSNEVAWALWGALIFDIPIARSAAIALSDVEDSVVALLALHLKSRGLVHASLNTTLWQSFLTTEELFGEQWLLCYEASVKGWLTSPLGTDHIGADARFTWLRDLGVEFYDVDKATAISASGAGGEPDWLSDLEEEMDARRSEYGEADENAEPGEEGLEF